MRYLTIAAFVLLAACRAVTAPDVPAERFAHGCIYTDTLDTIGSRGEHIMAIETAIVNKPADCESLATVYPTRVTPKP